MILHLPHMFVYCIRHSGWTQAVASDGSNKVRALYATGTECIEVLEVRLCCTQDASVFHKEKEQPQHKGDGACPSPQKPAAL